MTDVSLLVPEERYEDHSEGVDRCNECSASRSQEEPEITFVGCPRQPQYLIFAVKTSREKWKGSQGTGAYKEGPVDDRHFVFQSAHLKHVLLVMQRVNDC